MNRRYFNTVEAAQFLRVGKSSLEKKRLSGNGPPFIKFGRRVIYSQTDLESWLDAHREHQLCEAREAS